MVCKEELCSIFQNLQPHKRIDLMCGLLHLCLPLELRFLGSYMEDLGKKDFHYLREHELKANKTCEINELLENDDNTVRHKLAIYLSLLYSNHGLCSNSLYKILVTYLDRTVYNQQILGSNFDITVLQEMLTILTIAYNHPAFNFEQRNYMYTRYRNLEQQSHNLQQDIGAVLSTDTGTSSDRNGLADNLDNLPRFHPDWNIDDVISLGNPLPQQTLHRYPYEPASCDSPMSSTNSRSSTPPCGISHLLDSLQLTNHLPALANFTPDQLRTLRDEEYERLQVPLCDIQKIRNRLKLMSSHLRPDTSIPPPGYIFPHPHPPPLLPPTPHHFPLMVYTNQPSVPTVTHDRLSNEDSPASDADDRSSTSNSQSNKKKPEVKPHDQKQQPEPHINPPTPTCLTPMALPPGYPIDTTYLYRPPMFAFRHPRPAPVYITRPPYFCYSKPPQNNMHDVSMLKPGVNIFPVPPPPMQYIQHPGLPTFDSLNPNLMTSSLNRESPNPLQGPPQNLGGSGNRENGNLNINRESPNMVASINRDLPNQNMSSSFNREFPTNQNGIPLNVNRESPNQNVMTSSVYRDFPNHEGALVNRESPKLPTNIPQCSSATQLNSPNLPGANTFIPTTVQNNSEVLKTDESPLNLENQPSNSSSVISNNNTEIPVLSNPIETPIVLLNNPRITIARRDSSISLTDAINNDFNRPPCQNPPQVLPTDVPDVESIQFGVDSELPDDSGNFLDVATSEKSDNNPEISADVSVSQNSLVNSDDVLRNDENTTTVFKSETKLVTKCDNKSPVNKKSTKSEGNIITVLTTDTKSPINDPNLLTKSDDITKGAQTDCDSNLVLSCENMVGTIQDIDTSTSSDHAISTVTVTSVTYSVTTVTSSVTTVTTENIKPIFSPEIRENSEPVSADKINGENSSQNQNGGINGQNVAQNLQKNTQIEPKTERNFPSSDDYKNTKYNARKNMDHSQDYNRPDWRSASVHEWRNTNYSEYQNFDERKNSKSAGLRRDNRPFPNNKSAYKNNDNRQFRGKNPDSYHDNRPHHNRQHYPRSQEYNRQYNDQNYNSNVKITNVNRSYISPGISPQPLSRSPSVSGSVSPNPLFPNGIHPSEGLMPPTSLSLSTSGKFPPDQTFGSTNGKFPPDQTFVSANGIFPPEQTFGNFPEVTSLMSSVNKRAIVGKSFNSTPATSLTSVSSNEKLTNGQQRHQIIRPNGITQTTINDLIVAVTNANLQQNASPQQQNGVKVQQHNDGQQQSADNSVNVQQNGNSADNFAMSSGTTCYNCGITGHSAEQCAELTLQAVAGNYHLNFRPKQEAPE